MTQFYAWLQEASLLRSFLQSVVQHVADQIELALWFVSSLTLLHEIHASTVHTHFTRMQR